MLLFDIGVCNVSVQNTALYSFQFKPLMRRLFLKLYSAADSHTCWPPLCVSGSGAHAGNSRKQEPQHTDDTSTVDCLSNCFSHYFRTMFFFFPITSWLSQNVCSSQLIN